MEKPDKNVVVLCKPLKEGRKLVSIMLNDFCTNLEERNLHWLKVVNCPTNKVYNVGMVPKQPGSK